MTCSLSNQCIYRFWLHNQNAQPSSHPLGFDVPMWCSKRIPLNGGWFFRSFIKYLRIHRHPTIFNFKLLINPPGIILCDHHVRFGHKKHFSIREDKMPEEWDIFFLCIYIGCVTTSSVTCLFKDSELEVWSRSLNKNANFCIISV